MDATSVPKVAIGRRGGLIQTLSQQAAFPLILRRLSFQAVAPLSPNVSTSFILCFVEAIRQTVNLVRNLNTAIGKTDPFGCRSVGLIATE